VKAWQAFAVNIDGADYSVARNTRLRGSHAFVEAAPWNFVPDETTYEELPSLYGEYRPPEPRFSGPVKLRAKHRVLYRAATFEPGTTFTCDAANAEWLTSEGHAEEVA
jgi:hypothetical protein